MLAALGDLRASEDPQEKSLIGLVEAFTAAARRQPQAALGHARAVLAHADALGISSEFMRWAWPLATRATHDLGETAIASELLGLLDSYQPAHLAPMLRAERGLVSARLAASDGDPAAATAFAAAVSGLRELSTPITSATACSTRSSTSSACTTPKPPRQPSPKPAPSRVGCAVSCSWTGPQANPRKTSATGTESVIPLGPASPQHGPAVFGPRDPIVVSRACPNDCYLWPCRVGPSVRELFIRRRQTSCHQGTAGYAGIRPLRASVAWRTTSSSSRSGWDWKRAARGRASAIVRC
jgi:hypothetical protein